jgi:hypothetical protein
MADDRAVVGMYQERKSQEILICGIAHMYVWCLELYIVIYFFLFSFLMCGFVSVGL